MGRKRKRKYYNDRTGKWEYKSGRRKFSGKRISITMKILLLVFVAILAFVAGGLTLPNIL